MSTKDDLHKKEEDILQAVKQTLTRVIRDTATPPELKHPLSDDAIIMMRECLKLISVRERELAELLGREMSKRPYFIDDEARSKKEDGVVVSFDPSINKE